MVAIVAGVQENVGQSSTSGRLRGDADHLPLQPRKFNRPIQSHALKFDVKKITSATGTAPLPPPAKPGDTVGGIGRTNDAMLYGATVTFWVDASDEEIETVASDVPSCSSGDYGRPFATIFKDYEYDFYKVDPLLFSPASVTIHSLQSGNTWSYGRIETDILRQSFISK